MKIRKFWKSIWRKVVKLTKIIKKRTSRYVSYTFCILNPQGYQYGALAEGWSCYLTYEYNLICIIAIKASVEITVNAIEDYNFVGRNWNTIIKFSWRKVSKCWTLSEVWINVRGLRLKPLTHLWKKLHYRQSPKSSPEQLIGWIKYLSTIFRCIQNYVKHLTWSFLRK